MPSDDILTLPAPPADARLAYGTDPNQFGELRLPKSGGPFPIVMNIHGGFLGGKMFGMFEGVFFAPEAHGGVSNKRKLSAGLWQASHPKLSGIGHGRRARRRRRAG